jgi:hypothetical protein
VCVLGVDVCCVLELRVCLCAGLPCDCGDLCCSPSGRLVPSCVQGVWVCVWAGLRCDCGDLRCSPSGRLVVHDVQGGRVCVCGRDYGVIVGTSAAYRVDDSRCKVCKGVVCECDRDWWGAD